MAIGINNVKIKQMHVPETSNFKFNILQNSQNYNARYAQLSGGWYWIRIYAGSFSKIIIALNKFITTHVCSQ